MIEGNGYSRKRRRFSHEEKLVQNAAELPNLDPHLRRRVLDAALTAQAYGRFKHWVQLGVAAMLLIGSGLAVTGYYVALWRGEDFNPPSAAMAHEDSQTVESKSPPVENQEASLENSRNPSEDSHEWSLVEDSFSHRKRNERVLKSAFWD